MSEPLDIANLALGIIGTITGSIAVFIHFWRLLKENPRLKVEVDCEHDFAVSESGVKTISFWASFMIKNLGDRGTSLTDIGLTFEDNGNSHSLMKRYFRGMPQTNIIWINPHEALEFTAGFYDDLKGSDKEKIECTFSIYHTHGAKYVKAVSQKREEKERS